MLQLVSQPVPAGRCSCSSPSFRSICTAFSTYIHLLRSRCNFSSAICTFVDLRAQSKASPYVVPHLSPHRLCAPLPYYSIFVNVLTPSARMPWQVFSPFHGFINLFYFVVAVQHFSVHSASCVIPSVQRSRSTFMPYIYAVDASFHFHIGGSHGWYSSSATPHCTQ